MVSEFFERQKLRQGWELALILLPVLLLVGIGLSIAYQFVKPAPPPIVVMTTGSPAGAYHANGLKYKALLAKEGVNLELRPSHGSIENVARLLDPKSGVQIALVQGGLTSAQDAPNVVSLGQVYQEPLWIFYRGAQPKTKLTDFAGLRLSIGQEGSGTRPLVLELLKANKLTDRSAELFGYETEEAADKLLAGEVDAMFFATGANSPVVKRLLTAEGVRLMSLEQAEAYTRIYPYLAKVVLPEGFIDLAKNEPPADVAMLAPQASLLVREDLHPAIVGLLVDAAKDVHSMGGLFERTGEFPKPVDAGIPMSEDAQRVYASGRNFLHRHLRFWLATFIERTLVLTVPLATILLPLIKLVPMLYQWRIRRRIYHWYGHLKRLERDLAADRSPGAKMSYRDRIAKIEESISVIPVPLRYSEQLYMLRAAVALVRQRIAA